MRLKKVFLSVLTAGAVVLTGCSAADSEEDSSLTEVREEENLPVKIDMTQWQYNADADVYWQTGIAYCSNPADETYENLGIYVPGSYMSGKENEDGTYTCETELSGTAAGFTAETAPIVIPVDTPGYAAMNAPSGYVDSVSSYTDAGMIYVYAGCRGRDAGAPAGVTDLKAAIRYIRYNEDFVPGSVERIFSFGMSGGGAQSAVLGASGDSELYDPYLEAIGAVRDVSDAVAGSMCWCPITDLDYASEAYEWNLGSTRTDLSEDMQELSDAMAEQFALYINELGLQDEEGNALLLTASENGIYQAGSYYDHLKQTIEVSLNHFLEDTTFPYTVENSGGRGGFPGPDGEFGGEKGGFPGPDGELGGGRGGFPGPDGEFGGGKGGFPGPDGELGGEKGGFPGPDGENDGGLSEQNALYERDGIERNETTGGITLSGTYETVEDYINALNAETTWVIYDSAANTASITSIADFVNAFKTASKDLGAFDALDESQGENILFGDGDGEGDHFDSVMTKLLEDSEYGEEFAKDMLRTDPFGTTVSERVNMYTPLYYLSSYYDGYKTADPASFWRIRSGIDQSDTALTTEVNLALALENYGAEVDFETVWGQAHVEAERTGDSTTNFIEWVTSCCRDPAEK